jgi:NAD-dependent dihydropyrimidine dehydrogenase PreA subunit
MRVLAARPDLCTACGACEETCAMTFYRVPDRERSAIRITPPEVTDPHPRIEFCDQCGECIAVCPIPFKCIACAKCVDDCPTGALYMVEEAVPPTTTELTRSIRVKTGAGSHAS